MAVIGSDVKLAKSLLEQGELVAIPTETVYGLAANALDPFIVAKIFEVKNRPVFDPLIVHIHHLDQLLLFVNKFPQEALLLAERFWPGPLTLLLSKKEIIPDLVTSGLPQVGVRVPKHPLTLSLLESLDFPLAAPSANPFGYVSPTSAMHVEAQLGGKIPYILDGAECRVGIESTIIGWVEKKPTIYRLGGVSLEDIEETLAQKVKVIHSSSNPKAPGMLESHYAPKKIFYIDNLHALIQKYTPQKIGGIVFQEPLEDIPLENQIILSGKGDFLEAAQHLFAAMRQLDNAPLEVIFAKLLPEKSLGRAINDRLRRAAAR